MKPIVSIIMGSTSDLPVMEKAAKLLDEMHVPFEMNALSAHRTPEAVEEFAKNAAGRGIKVIIAAAGISSKLERQLIIRNPPLLNPFIILMYFVNNHLLLLIISCLFPAQPYIIFQKYQDNQNTYNQQNQPHQICKKIHNILPCSLFFAFKIHNA